MQHRAHGKVRRTHRLYHQVLLAVRDHARVRQFRENDARVRHLAGDRLVAEIEAEPPGPGPADHARQQRRRRQKIKIRQPVAVAGVPEHARPRAQFNPCPPRVDGKGGRPAPDHSRHGKAPRDQLSAEGIDPGDRRGGRGDAFLEGALPEVAVVSVQTAGA